MSRLMPFTWCAILVVCSQSASAQTAEGNALIFPITTDLQRKLLGGRHDLFVLVNADAAIRDALVDAQALDLDGLMRRIKEKKLPEDASVFIRVRRTSTGDGDRAAHELLLHAFRGVGQAYGMPKTRVGSSFEFDDWEDMLAQVNEKTAGQADADEPATGDDLVKAYPVRTILSRCLTRNADCYVEMRPFIEHREGSMLRPEVRQAIAAALAKLALSDKQRLIVHVRSRGEGRMTVDRFVENELKEFAASLGFEVCSIAHSPY